MRTGRKFFVGMSILFPELVLLGCVIYFPLMAGKVEYIQPRLFLWICVTVAGFAVNLFLCRRTIIWRRLFVWNLIWMVCSALAGYHGTVAPGHVPGIVAAVLLIAIQGHGIYIACSEANAEQCVLVLDGVIVVFAVYLLVNDRIAFTEDVLLAVCGFVAVGWCLIGLILLRTFRQGDSVVVGDRSKAAGMAGGLIGVLAALAVLIILGSSKNSGSLAAVLMHGFLELLRQIRRGLAWIGGLLSKLFAGFSQDGNSFAGEPVRLQSYEEVPVDFEPTMLPMWLYVLLGVILLALLGCFLFYVFRRLRGRETRTESGKYRAVFVQGESIQEESERFWARFRKKWEFRRLVKKNKRTVRGLYYELERKGAAAGLPQKNGESGSAYLKRLAQVLSEEAGTAKNALFKIAALLQQELYSNDAVILSGEEYETLHRSLDKLGAELKCSHMKEGMV